MASPEQVSAAVHALYGAHDPSQQQQANQWLLSFQKSEQAWRVPFVLLVPEQPDEVQFFAATLLIQKVRTEWVKLDQASKQDLSQAIR
jgi:transportin-3